MEYSIVENNLVVNVVVAHRPLAPNWHEGNHRIGATYLDGAFTFPVGIAIPTPSIRLTKLEYMNRFTDSELATIYTAAKTVVSVEIWLEKFKLASEINLDDPYTIGGLQAMEAAGLIGVGRAAEILA
jgi:hypothetical protein